LDWHLAVFLLALVLVARLPKAKIDEEAGGPGGA
jgi:hypothetical protein